MKHISEIANVSSLSMAREEKVEQETLNPLACELVDKIFGSFLLLCRGFDSLYADINRLKAEKTKWFAYFTKNNIISLQQIKHGLEKLNKWTFPNPPQLGVFIEWCKPEAQDIGLPETDRAYLISIEINAQFSTYTHPDTRVDAIIRHAISQIGKNEYRKMTAENSKKAFKYYYAKAIQQFIDGKLDVIQKSLPDRDNVSIENKEKNDTANKIAMEAIRKMLR